MSDLYGFAYTLDETLKTMEDVISTGNHDRMFLDTYYWLKTLKEYQEIGTVEECRKLASIVNKAERDELDKIIDEWLKYSKIGTAEECREAVEKQKAKKVIDRDLDLGYYTCPSCGTAISFMEDGYKSHKFCLNCGQAILQENEDD